MSTALSEGWGSTTGAYGAWGATDIGYGDPLTVPGASVLSPADGVVPDDGGEWVTLQGGFAAGPYTVTAGGRSCPSGVPGRGVNCYPNAARTELRFVVPRLPVGSHDVVLTRDGGAVTLLDALRVVRRTRQSGVYDLRRLLPSGRSVGPRSIDAETLLTGSSEIP